MNIQKLQKMLTVGFVLLVILKYVFNQNIHEKYLFFIASSLAIIATNIVSKPELMTLPGINNLTIPGDLTVNGKVTVKGVTKCENDLEVKKGKKFICRGLSYFEHQTRPGNYSHMNWTNGNIYLRGNVNIDGGKSDVRDSATPLGRVLNVKDVVVKGTIQKA